MFKKKICFLTLVSFFLLSLSGCVAQKTHLKVVDEAKRLKTVSKRQEKAVKKLKTELAEAEATKSEAVKNLEKELEKTKLKKDDLEKKVAESEREIEIQQQLITALKDEIEGGKVEVAKMKHQTHIRLRDSILFDSGEVKLKPEGIKILKKLGNQLKTIKDRQILIEGHTDNKPIRERLKSVYTSNLALSAARALSVANHQMRQGVAGKRVVVLAYGEHRPIADNSSPEGRKKNRRVTIVLVKKSDIFDDSQYKTK